MPLTRYTLEDLLRVMQRLRDPQDGCPWDLAQDFDTIVPSTLEECYELAAAIEAGDMDHLAEELGDVLFQVVFYTQMGQERGLFSFASVVDTLAAKLVRRHPHVFANGELEGRLEEGVSVEQVNNTWELIKQQERTAKSQHGVLADVPVALPALPRAQKVQKRAAQVNFDWNETGQVLDKLEEEIAELRAALAEDDKTAIDEEMGDLLFSMVNLCRHLRLDAESALRGATRKFESRFSEMESLAARANQSLDTLSPAQWDALWLQAKEAGRGL